MHLLRVPRGGAGDDARGPRARHAADGDGDVEPVPLRAGHLLVPPTKHVDSFEALSHEEYVALCALLRASTAALRRAVTPDGMNVGYNLGKAAGAGIAEHLHAHVVPRWNGDANFMPVVADTRVMPEHLDATWRSSGRSSNSFPA